MHSTKLTIAIFLIAINLCASDILFFNQDCNLDLTGADNSCADERSNLLNIVEAKGHNVTLLPDFHQTNFEDLLSENDFLLVPDLEDAFTSCNVSDPLFLSLEEKKILKSYIENGGSLLIAGSSQNINFLNDVFGLNLLASGVVSTGISIKNEEDAIGTPYETCDNQIPNSDATFLINSSMPVGKKCIYGTGTSASIANFQIGLGSITYLGYDFNNAGPGCLQSTNLWTGCIADSSIIAATSGILSQTVPTLSQWGLICLGLILMIFSLVTIKSRNFVIT